MSIRIEFLNIDDNPVGVTLIETELDNDHEAWTALADWLICKRPDEVAEALQNVADRARYGTERWSAS